MGRQHAHPITGRSRGDHAADAAALLNYLGYREPTSPATPPERSSRHSLAVDDPTIVQTLVLLEPFVLAVPSGEAVLQQAGPAFEAYGHCDPERAWAVFLSAASGLEREAGRALREEGIPGVVPQVVKDADTLFGVELPAMAAWALGPDRAAAIGCPTLSVLGTATLPLFAEVAALLRKSLADIEECRIEGVGHLLHIQRPDAVALAIAEFLGRHPMVRG